MSKGHAAPLLYSVFALAGGLKREELLNLRKFGSRLEGHPTPKFKFAEAATGSLGQGLSIGAGIALSGKKDNLNFKTFVLLGDGEIAEGQIYEACNFANIYKLDNLIVIADVNNLGQTGKTAFDYELTHYDKVFSSLGFLTKIIDGHNFSQIDSAFSESVNNKSGKPFIILAKTIKGKGVSFLQGREDFHGKAVSKDDLPKALTELSENENIVHDNKVMFYFNKPVDLSVKTVKKTTDNISIPFSRSDEIATREAFGYGLLELGKHDDSIFVFDGDVANSTYTDKFKKEFPNRFIECFIAEQNMVSAAGGVSIRGKTPYVATFGAFLTRAFDQIRMARISNFNIKFVGSHAGVSIGEDGPSQMALEDIAMFSAVPDSVVLQPCDGLSAFKLTLKLNQHKGISYLRTLRPKTLIIYKENDDFEIGGAKILRQSDKDELLVVCSGITVFEGLCAYEQLLKENINICVLDAYSIKPLDKQTILESVNKTKRKIIITVEDHYINGGLGDAVISVLSNEKIEVVKMGIEKVPCSGDMQSLLDVFGISSNKIKEKVSKLVF